MEIIFLGIVIRSNFNLPKLRKSNNELTDDIDQHKVNEQSIGSIANLDKSNYKSRLEKLKLKLPDCLNHNISIKDLKTSILKPSPKKTRNIANSQTLQGQSYDNTSDE